MMFAASVLRVFTTSLFVIMGAQNESDTGPNLSRYIKYDF